MPHLAVHVQCTALGFPCVLEQYALSWWKVATLFVLYEGERGPKNCLFSIWTSLESNRGLINFYLISGSFRKQWTPGAIFSRIGLPKSLLKPGLYDEIIEKLNKEGDPVEILHPVAFVHCYKKNQLEKQAQDAKVNICCYFLSRRLN